MCFKPALSPVEIYAEKEGIVVLGGFCTETMQSHTCSDYNPEILLEILH